MKWTFLVIPLYYCAHVAFVKMTPDQGLITPAEAPDLPLLLLGALVLGLRVLLLFLPGLWVGWGLKALAQAVGNRSFLR